MPMVWSDERYVRIYTRDTADWQCLSFLAQGLFCLLLRKVDRAGVLQLGRSGHKAVAIAIGHAHQWPMLEPALEELLADGCIEIVDGNLVVPNFLDAQEAEASDKARAKKYREVRRDTHRSGVVTTPRSTQAPLLAESQNVTPRHADPVVCDGTDTERDASDTVRVATVTPSRTVPSRTSLAEPGETTAAARLPGRVELLRQTYPATTALVDASGGFFDFSASKERRDAVERATAKIGTDRALAAAQASYTKTPKTHLGWHLDALRAAALPDQVTPSIPSVDTTWIELLPEPHRAEAHAAWEAKKAEVETYPDATRIPLLLANWADSLRQRFTQAAGATP